MLPICEIHAPQVNIKIRDNEPPWVTDELRSISNDRDHFKEKAEQSNSPSDWAKFKKYKNKTNNLVSQLKKDFANHSIESNHRNPRDLWREIRKLIPTTALQGPSKLLDGNNEVTDSKDMANMFNDFFASIGNSLAKKIPNAGHQNIPKKTNAVFHFSPITPDFVKLHFQKLPNGKATGLDTLSTRLLKTGVENFSTPLTHIFNLSLTSGKVPEEWKTARITPIFKEGSKTDVNNYRPISVLPVTLKVLERAVHDQFYLFLTDHNLLTPNQSGFRKQHSTSTALLHIIDMMQRDIDGGKCCGVLFLDLKKAFDTVDHQILLKKMVSYGVEGNALQWFDSYLSNRQQRTLINDSLSEPKLVTCGVPQGSIIGPLLFILYINDLPDRILHCEIFLYADDTALYYAADNSHIIEDVLNTEMQNVSDWFMTNKLTLNSKKTKVMIFGTSKRLKALPPLNIRCGNDQIEQVSVFKYLGILLDSTLSFSEHIDYVCKKVNMRLSVLGRTRKYLSVKTSLMLYKSLVMPYFDYCDTLWDCCSCQLKQKLQILQNRALRIINKADRRTHISDLHNMSKILTLEQRRKYHTHVFMYKALNNLCPDYISSKFCYSSNIHQHSTRSASSNSLHIPRINLNVGKSRISYRGAISWNSLPPEIRQAPTLRLFKKWSFPSVY